MADEKQFQLDEAQPSRLTDWAKEPSILSLKTDLENAKNSHDAQMAKIQRWNDLMYVKGSAAVPKRNGRSSIQPKLIRRQAEWRYSALTEPFLSSQKMFSVSPVTFEDEDSAKQNELVLNWQFRTKLNIVKTVDDMIRSVVDEGTGVIQVGWLRHVISVNEEVPTFDHFAITTEDQVIPLQQALELAQANPREYDEKVPPELKAAVDLFNETGEATVAVQSGTTTQQVEKVLENRPTIVIHNPQNVIIDPSCQGDLDKALFAVVSFETNKSELEKTPDRYRNLDRVNWEGNTPVTSQDHATNTPDTFNYQDAARKKVVAYEYWGYYDIDNSGSLTAIVATWIGDTIIRMERNPFPDGKLPFVVIPYLPVKRSLYGEPDAELLEDNQKTQGAVMRGVIDLLARSANSQRGIAKGMLDPVNRRRFESGEDYEYNPTQNPQTNYIEHKYPELSASALQMMNIQNQEAESLSGVKAFAGGLSGDQYGDVAAGIRSVLDASSKREMAILRRVAKGMVEIGHKILAMNAEFLSEKEVIRVTNKEYVTVFRDDLAGNFDLVVDISTAEVDNSKAQDLGFMLQTLGPNMDPQISMNILAEIAELKRMPALAERLRTWRPQPDPLEEAIKQAEVQKLQKEVEKLDSEIELNLARAARERSQKDKADLDFVEQETGTTHAREMQKQQAQAQGNQELQITKALTTPRKEGETPPNLDAALGYNALSGGQTPQSTFTLGATPQ